MSFSSDAPLLANQVSDFDLPENYEDFSEIFDREHKKVIDSVNSKEGGLYLPQEVATFQKYFSEESSQATRNTYRKLIMFGALPNATSKRVPHNIAFNNVTRMTRMFGAASNPTTIQFYPLPFSSPTLVENVKLEANATDVIITTGSDYSGFTDVTVVMEYSKDL